MIPLKLRAKNIAFNKFVKSAELKQNRHIADNDNLKKGINYRDRDFGGIKERIVIYEKRLHGMREYVGYHIYGFIKIGTQLYRKIHSVGPEKHSQDWHKVDSL